MRRGNPPAIKYTSLLDQLREIFGSIREKGLWSYIKYCRELERPDDPNNHLAILAPLMPQKLYKRLLHDLRGDVYTDLGFSILHRWALNQPEALKRLLRERDGKKMLLCELYVQQEIEARTPPPNFILWARSAEEASDTTWARCRRKMDDREVLEYAFTALSA